MIRVAAVAVAIAIAVAVVVVGIVKAARAIQLLGIFLLQQYLLVLHNGFVL